ncbi:MAG: hypothetical protein P8J75_03045 [Actinomycetota bacterium]|nr:hypothetical protein [Actinomycetota bacterium]
MKKSLFFAATLVAVAVFGASACSYSDEAEPGVRNLALGTKTERVKPDISDGCERTYISVSWTCLTESEQQRAAGLVYGVNQLVVYSDDTVSYLDRADTLRFISLLIEFEALEVFCYTAVMESMSEERVWPMASIHLVPGLLDQLRNVRFTIDYDLSKSTVTGIGETPLFEPIKYRHLCPSWILEP